MLLGVALCGLGAGACVLAHPARARRLPGVRLSPAAPLALRLGGAALLGAALLPLARELGPALALPAWLALAPAALSLAALSFPLAPRAYALTLLAALAAILAGVAQPGESAPPLGLRADAAGACCA